MLKESELAGNIIIDRQEPEPFTEKHIELVTNFAARTTRHVFPAWPVGILPTLSPTPVASPWDDPEMF